VASPAASISSLDREASRARAACCPATAPCAGTGVTESGEACDDGNGDPTDGCTNACQPATCGDGIPHQGTEQCDTGVQTEVCDANCTTAYCGDGTTNVNRGEACDGGGGFTAGCDNDCTPTSCGDGLTNRPAGEVCDDGNNVNTDECTNACQYGP